MVRQQSNVITETFSFLDTNPLFSHMDEKPVQNHALRNVAAHSAIWLS